MLRIIVATLAIFFSASLAAADCADPANQAEVTQCANEAADAADASLNEAYTKLAAMLSSEDQVLLIEAQRAWIAFRDAECSFRTKSYEDGTIYGTLLANCVAELSSARAGQLIDQVNCGEGDLCVPHVAPAAPETPPENEMTRPCLITAGMRRAQLYASQCSAVTSEDNERCHFETACGVMIEDIKKGCAAEGSTAPRFCATYLGKEKPKP